MISSFFKIGYGFVMGYTTGLTLKKVCNNLFKL